MDGRAESLERPRGAARVPFLAFFLVLLLVVATIAVGLSPVGWLGAMLVPALGFTLYIVVRVGLVLWRERRTG